MSSKFSNDEKSSSITDERSSIDNSDASSETSSSSMTDDCDEYIPDEFECTYKGIMERQRMMGIDKDTEILCYDEPRYLSLIKMYLMYLTGLQSIFVNIIVEMIIEGNELYFEYKTLKLEEYLKIYLNNYMANDNSDDNDNIDDNMGYCNEFKELTRSNKSFIKKNISYIISLYVGEYGWNSETNIQFQYHSHSSQIVYHWDNWDYSADVVCATSDEEIFSNKNKYGYWYCNILVNSKNDEGWIGVYWDTHFPIADISYGYSIRYDQRMISYYGGREEYIEDDINEYVTEYSLGTINRNDINVNKYLSWYKAKRFDANNSFRSTDCGCGAIHGYNINHYSDDITSNEPLRWYSHGDTVGIYVNVDQKSVQFYCNGVKQGPHIKLPLNINKLWAFATTDSDGDILLFQRKLYMDR